MIRPNIVILARPQRFVRFADELSDGQPLWTFALTGGASEALNRSMLANRFVVCLPRDTQILILVQCIEARKHVWDPDSRGAALVHAVATARTADRPLARDDHRRPLEHIALADRQRFEVVQQHTDILFHLREVAHAGEHGQHAIE